MKKKMLTNSKNHSSDNPRNPAATMLSYSFQERRPLLLSPSLTDIFTILT